ncbi:unnamed protein product [Cyprideis torosa]|uniref:Uncharacterized protein n=1 Tax=Cyprideis torosa TaxID=163714 RepID=A0A7R8W5E1_9CRUS|nr:unnamed protein product [Cyprideis torosa]CAG0884184.1 unnamed protein product [Cyprideis torosa]
MRPSFLCTLLLLVILVVAECSPAPGRKRHRRQRNRESMPLKGERGYRKTRRSSVCRMGKTKYGLESTWNPDLGPPFGIMACIQCECVPVKRKRRVKGKVRCRNIKNECPAVTCASPVIIPGKCCKSCPDDVNQDLPVSKTEVFSVNPPQALKDAPHEDIFDEKDSKLFAAVLVSKKSSRAATGRFTFKKKGIYYSFLTTNTRSSSGRWTHEGDGFIRPSNVWFMNQEGEILEDIPIPEKGTEMEQKSGKLCGAWRPMLRKYRKLLKDEHLRVALVYGNSSEPEEVLEGSVKRQIGLETEMFTALLSSDAGHSNAGGTGIAAVDAEIGSLYVNLIFTGLYPESADSLDVPFTIRLRSAKFDEIHSEQTIVVSKLHQDLNRVEIREPLSQYQLRALSRGNLVIDVFANGHEKMGISGPILTAATCTAFSTLLTMPPPAKADLNSNGKGFGQLWLTPDGRLTYSLFLTGLSSPVETAELWLQGPRKKDKLLEDITSFKQGSWINGSYTKTNAKELLALYDGGLYFKITTTAYPVGELFGRSVAVPWSEPHLSDRPIILMDPKKSAVVMAWMALNDDCEGSLQVRAEGYEDGTLSTLLLDEDVSLNMALTESESKLVSFHGGKWEGKIPELSPFTLQKVQMEELSMKFRQTDSEMSARIHDDQFFFPRVCLPNEGAESPGNQYIDGVLQGDSSDNKVEDDPRCLTHDKQIKQEHEQWIDPQFKCRTCTCLRGKIKCDAMVCPALTCANPVQKDGDCCPTCPETTEREGSCFFVNRNYHVGEQFHPYIPPRGYDTCVDCSCRSDLQVICRRKACPPLTCSPNEAYRANDTDCCLTCPKKPDTPVVFVQEDSGMTEHERVTMILNNGGCKFIDTIMHNGEERSPVTQPFGEMSCIKCRCKTSLYSIRLDVKYIIVIASIIDIDASLSSQEEAAGEGRLLENKGSVPPHKKKRADSDTQFHFTSHDDDADQAEA